MPKQIDFGSASMPERKVVVIDSFAGVDLSSSPTDVDKRRSPNAPNMMPDTKGNPKKRPGFEVVKTFAGRINGRWEIAGKEVIHAGTRLYIDGAQVWSGMADERSTGEIIGDNLYIFDGARALKCDGFDAYPISYDAYIPTVLISKNADYYYFSDTFTGDGEKKRFTLSRGADEISATVGGTAAAVTLENGNEAVFATAPAASAIEAGNGLVVDVQHVRIRIDLQSAEGDGGAGRQGERGLQPYRRNVEGELSLQGGNGKGIHAVPKKA